MVKFTLNIQKVGLNKNSVNQDQGIRHSVSTNYPCLYQVVGHVCGKGPHQPVHLLSLI